jgi:hypothetical protein
VQAPGFERVGISLGLLFLAPFLLVLAYRLLTRGTSREPIGIDASPRLQRMELAIESIAMDVERLAEGQRFTTRILAERHPEAVAHAQATPPQGADATAPD